MFGVSCVETVPRFTGKCRGKSPSVVTSTVVEIKALSEMEFSCPVKIGQDLFKVTGHVD